MIQEVDELIIVAKEFNPRLPGNHRSNLKSKISDLINAMEEDEGWSETEINELKQSCEEIEDD